MEKGELLDDGGALLGDGEVNREAGGTATAAQRRHAASVKAQVAHASARTSQRRIVMYFAPEW